MEGPLQEMDVCSSLGSGGFRALLFGLFLAGLLAREGEDELGVLAGGCENPLVGVERDCGADMGRVIRMP